MTVVPSPALPPAGLVDPHNAFTVDLEEWFHVCGVEPLRFERWATLPSRVEPTTRWLLDALDRADVRATFFIVGWVAERFPRLARSGRTGTRTGACTSSTVRPSGAISRPACRH
jgi:hypothetical protein